MFWEWGCPKRGDAHITISPPYWKTIGDEVVVLASKIQKSGKGDNNFVKMKRDISFQPTKGGPKYFVWTEP